MEYNSVQCSWDISAEERGEGKYSTRETPIVMVAIYNGKFWEPVYFWKFIFNSYYPLHHFLLIWKVTSQKGK